MLDLAGDGRATLYELELIGGVELPAPDKMPGQRVSSFRVTALWPEAAAMAGRQLFIGEAARRGLVVMPGLLQVRRCTPLKR